MHNWPDHTVFNHVDASTCTSLLFRMRPESCWYWTGFSACQAPNGCNVYIMRVVCMLPYVQEHLNVYAASLKIEMGIIHPNREPVRQIGHHQNYRAKNV